MTLSLRQRQSLTGGGGDANDHDRRTFAMKLPSTRLVDARLVERLHKDQEDNYEPIDRSYQNRAREILDLFCSDAAPNGGQIGQLVAAHFPVA